MAELKCFSKLEYLSITHPGSIAILDECKDILVQAFPLPAVRVVVGSAQKNLKLVEEPKDGRPARYAELTSAEGDEMWLYHCRTRWKQ